MSANTLLRQTEVGQACVAVFVKHDVIGLQVTENNLLLVQVFKRQHDLSSVDLNQLHAKASVFCECHTHITTWAVLHNQVQA